jgi:hypothetical protein
MLSWARLNLAAATIFMALVICCVELTDTIRLRTSFKLAIYLLINPGPGQYTRGNGLLMDETYFL